MLGHVKFVPTRTRYAAFVLLVALLASLVVAAFRVRVEEQTRRVEIAMDYNDFLTLAHAYDYNPEAFLVELRRAGLTSLALAEELGSAVGTSKSAYVTSGVGLLDAARISPLADPTLAALVRGNRIHPNAVYLLVYDRSTFKRFMQQLPLHFERSGIRVLHASLPYVISVRTQIDYFNTVALGIPHREIALTRKLGLFVIPRFQNDERLRRPQMEEMIDDLHAGKWISTIIFFGMRNQVLGYPDHIKGAAAVFKTHAFNYGEIETYDPSQVQKGNVSLARLIPGRIVRVQAIAKLELDKLTIPEIVARYELGVRERNIRVVYLRPISHRYRGLSIEKSNVEMVRDIATALKSQGFKLGRATPIPLYRGNNAILVGLAALAVPSIFVLLLDWYGWYRRRLAAAAYGLTLLLYLAGVATHHDIIARSLIALAGALLFAAAAFTAIGPAFYEEPAPGGGTQLLRSLRWTLVATGVAMLGALVVIGVMSSPLVMEEVEPFRGVKLLLATPPLAALLLYVLTDRFNARVGDAKAAFAAPVRIYQLLVGIAVLGAGLFVLMRSGNQSEIAPSAIELWLRAHLTEWLSVRPRFKEFLLGFPLLMLLPALRGTHRRAVGILFALGIGVSLGDMIDTFSHLHTPVLVAVLRIFNGLVLGAIVGAIAIWIYRSIVRRYAPPASS